MSPQCSRIGVGLSLPLPLWNWNGGNIAAAEARILQVEVSYAVTEREVERQVAQAALTHQTKVREMAMWRPDSIQHFREAADSEVGGIPSQWKN